MGQMATYYAWVEDGADGREGVIAYALPFMPDRALSPLMARSEVLARRLKSYAEAHAEASGHKVRLVRFVRAEVLEEYQPGIGDAA